MSARDSEFAPPHLVAFGDAVRAAFQLGPLAVAMERGDDHTYGYHRSRNWIMVDGDGDDDYSVQLSLDQGGDGNGISAVDISLDQDRMTAVTGRLLAAARAGDPRLDAVREFYGTVDGRTVTGWDAAYHRAVTADDSHLGHVHLSFYRSLADSDHGDLLAVVTTGLVTEAKTPETTETGAEASKPTPDDRLARMEASLAAIRAELARISGGTAARDPAGSVDVRALAEELRPYLGAAVAAELARRLHELADRLQE